MIALTAALCSLYVLFSPAFCGSIPNQFGIQTGPKNVAVLAGESTTFTCVTGDGAHVRWYEYVTNPSGGVISDGTTLLPGHPNFDRYELVPSGSNTFSLKIKNINLNDAGYYECHDQNAVSSSTQRLGAQLVVIEALPNCEQSFPADGTTIEGQYHLAECSLRYRAAAGIAPLMTWSGPGVFKQTTVTTNTTVSASLLLRVHRNITARNWICKTNFTTTGFGGQSSATNAPTWQHLAPTNTIAVYWPPANFTMIPLLSTYEVGQTIKCTADANPVAKYTWQSLRTSEKWYTSTITLRPDMVGYQLMRCTAQNDIQRYTLSRDYYFDVFVNAPTSPPTTTTTVPMTTTPVPTTTTAVPTFPPLAPCNDITGRWEVAHSDGARSVLCIDVNHKGLVHGQWWNNTNDLFSSEIIGTTDEEFYDIGFLTKRNGHVGVTLFAGKCQKCGDAESLYLHVIHQSNPDQATCAAKGTTLRSDKWNLARVSAVSSCPSSYAAMEDNTIKVEVQLPDHRHREVVMPVKQ